MTRLSITLCTIGAVGRPSHPMLGWCIDTATSGVGAERTPRPLPSIESILIACAGPRGETIHLHPDEATLQDSMVNLGCGKEALRRDAMPDDIEARFRLVD